MGIAAGQTVLACIEMLDQRFQDADLFYGHGSDNSWDEAVFLVLGACNLPLESGDEVATVSLTSAQADRVNDWMNQRVIERKPLPYISGKAWLGGAEFLCDKRALVPRSPLAEVILNDFQPWCNDVRSKDVLDLCCGGGSLGILAALNHAENQVVLADIDPDALTLAQLNVVKHQLESRVQCVQSDVLASVPQRYFDIVICNPPYVDSEDMSHLPAEYLHEPQIALASGQDGLDFTRQLLAQLPKFLHSNSVVFLELGNSWEQFEELFPQTAITWLEFERGGWGVCVLTKSEVEELALALT